MIKIFKKILSKILMHDSDIIYHYTDFNIKLPQNHLLPTYQKKHKTYDKFLPHLAAYLSPNDLVIDVGANCGDTLASMAAKNPELQFACIEPDEKFYSYLLKNIANINKYLTTAAHPIKSLVGKDIISASLSGNNSTKKAILNNKTDKKEHTIASQKLDDIFITEIESRFKIGPRLIKSDVDGYDYDIINSAERIISKHKPIIFFECDYSEEQQKKNYSKLLEKLLMQNYSAFWLFDNFGEFLLKTENIHSMENVIEYVWRQNKHGSTRTIYYFDILCCTEKDSLMLSRVVDDYINDVLSKK